MKNFVRFSAILLVFLFAAYCSQENEAPTTSTDQTGNLADEDGLLAGQAAAEADMDAPRAERQRAAQPGAPADDRTQGPTAILPRFDLAEGRLLEYVITLRYRTNDFEKARVFLLAFASRNGYINSSSARFTDDPYLATTLRVRSDRVYEALQDLNEVGVLLSEDISVVDHTEEMVIAARQYRREQIRSQRRARAGAATPGTNRNWDEIEQLLEASENRQDQAEHEQWRINDRVEWATLNIQLEGPETTDTISVPNYTNALIGFVNTLLWMLYGLLWISPVLVLLAAIAYGLRFWYRKRSQKA
ncbi:MAG: DUF4349 domain-containing protein [Spirochaetales bacterium]|nr:DUF4349 domain-containing protein [Leptospiraceae bacterium]MCP5482248.1 DUF4349 domain-containing protein [Spirochaetales bacterium]